MTEIAKLKFSISELGIGTATLNGIDLGRIVSSIEFKSTVGEFTEIKLTMMVEVDAEIEAKLSQIALARPSPKSEDGIASIQLLNGNVLKQRTR